MIKKIISKNKQKRQYPKIWSKEEYVINMNLAVEWGFKCHEEGHNIDYAKSKFNQILLEK